MEPTLPEPTPIVSNSVEFTSVTSPVVQSVPQSVTEPIEKPPINSNLFFIILAVFVVILGIIFVVLITKFLSTSKDSATKPVLPPVYLDGADSWSSYSNSILKYSINYPPTWTLMEKSKGKLVEIYNQPDKTKSVGKIFIEKIAQVPRNYPDYVDIKNIGNIPAHCFSDQEIKTFCYFETEKSEIISFLIIKDNDEAYNLIVDKILSTFTSTIKTPRISIKQLIIGWYWGNNEEKLSGTPSSWKYKEAGKSSCWHRIGVTCK